MAAAPKKKKRSREEHELELRRLKAMYAALPSAKQAVHRPHMQARIDKLVKAINEDGKPVKRSGGMMQTIMLSLLVCVLALGAGFFAVTYLAHSP
jgi:hypothetical protein